MAAQATSWQPANCDMVRVGETVKASVAKLCGDPPSLRELLLAMLNRGGRRLRLLPWEDLPPPIGIGGGDPSAATKSLAGRDTIIQWPSRQAVHQLGPRPAASPPSSPRSLPSSVHDATALSHDRTSLGARRGHIYRLCRVMNCVEVGCRVVVVGLVAVVVRPSTALRAPTREATRVERGRVR